MRDAGLASCNGVYGKISEDGDEKPRWLHPGGAILFFEPGTGHWALSPTFDMTQPKPARRA